MEIPEEPAKAAHEKQLAAGRNAAVDDLTTAIMTGASPEEISRLEASGSNSRNSNDEAWDSLADGQQEAGELPPRAFSI